MKRLIARSLMVVLCAGVAYPAAAQEGAKDEAKKAGEQTKEAGQDAGSAAKHAGKATAKATKKTGKAVKNVVTGAPTACDAWRRPGSPRRRCASSSPWRSTAVAAA